MVALFYFWRQFETTASCERVLSSFLGTALLLLLLFTSSLKDDYHLDSIIPGGNGCVVVALKATQPFALCKCFLVHIKLT